MTPSDKAEWDYVYTERLGHLCGKDKPTPDQEALAKADADAAVRHFVKRNHVAQQTAFVLHES